MKKVLVIEDSSEVRHLISEMLEAHGFEVLTAADGLVGSDLADFHRPDLVICDLCMPGLDGVGTWSRIRGRPDTAGIPFVFLSGLADMPSVDGEWNPVKEAFLPKPFTLAELIGAVHLRLGAVSGQPAPISHPSV